MVTRIHKTNGKRYEIVKWPTFGKTCIVRATFGARKEHTVYKKDLIEEK